MSVVKGAIAIKDNATAVLKNIKKEQTFFRNDVIKTKNELKRTWDKKYEAKIDTTSATKKANELNSKLKKMPKSITTLIKAKDLASSKIDLIKGKIKSVGKMVASPFIKLKDKVTSKLSPIVGKIKSVGKMIASPIVKIKDKVSAGISSIKGKLKSLTKTLAIPIVVTATVATAAIGKAVSSGMELEQQQVSMKHFIGATNKGMGEDQVSKVADEFTKALRENANATPFETGDVIKAGSRAIAVANGDTKEAMNLVKLAGDMAAASGGTKTIGDAIEALADAKLGETERLKEFGFKVSAEEFDAKGFKGVSSDLQNFYGGAAEKLATTGSGLLSTIKGKLKSNFADFGLKVVDKLKPAFDGVIGLIDKSSPAIEAFGTNLAEKIGNGITFVVGLIPKITSALATIKPVFDSIINGFKPLMPQLSAFGSMIMTTVGQVAVGVLPAITSIIATVQNVIPAVLPVLQTGITTIAAVITQATPIISGLIEGIGTVITTLAPVFNTIFGSIAEKVGSVIGFISERMGFITEIINWAAPLISDILTTAWSVISPVMDICINVFKIIFSVVQKVFPGIQKIITTVWNIIKPLVEGIGGVIGGISKGIGWIADKFTGGDKKKVGTNAKGTNSWRGGTTWVGEEGPELVDLPVGSRVLPTKESMKFAGSQSQPVINSPQVMQSVNMANNSIIKAEPNGKENFLSRIDKNLRIIAQIFIQKGAELLSQGISLPKSVIKKADEDTINVPDAVSNNTNKTIQKVMGAITVTIAKLADTIVIREDADIDKIGASVAKKIVEVAKNMA